MYTVEINNCMNTCSMLKCTNILYSVIAKFDMINIVLRNVDVRIRWILISIHKHKHIHKQLIISRIISNRLSMTIKVKDICYIFYALIIRFMSLCTNIMLHIDV